MKTKKVIVHPYDKAWESAFEKIKAELESAIGIGFVLRNVVLTFIPGGRKKHERYADYRARKLEGLKKEGDHCILVTGLSFLALGVLFSVIWSVMFY